MLLSTRSSIGQQKGSLLVLGVKLVQPLLRIRCTTPSYAESIMACEEAHNRQSLSGHIVENDILPVRSPMFFAH